jgi:hypothetical protein
MIRPFCGGLSAGLRAPLTRPPAEAGRINCLTPSPLGRRWPAGLVTG